MKDNPVEQLTNDIASISVKIKVKKCARCQKNHTTEFFLFRNNPILDYSHWGICENTNEPVLMKFVESESQ